MKSYFISVGEPWDFESEDGENIIKGEVLRILDNHCLVFKSNHPLKFGIYEGQILILKPRHYVSNFSDLGRRMVPVNGSLLLTEYNENLLENYLIDNAKFVIAGSIRNEKYHI